MASIRWAMGAVALGALALLAASYMGALHPLGDSLAAFRTGIAVTLGLAAALASARGLRLACLAFAALALGVRALLLLPGAAPGPVTLTLYQKNMLHDNATPTALAADIRASGADVVTVQELRRPGWEMLETLSDLYPHVARCGDRRPGPVAVLSRRPFAPGGPLCALGEGLIAAPVETPQGRVWIASLHLAWPFPFAGAEQAERVAPHLAGLDGPVVLGGDFNMVPWSHTVRVIRDALGAERPGPVMPTLHLPGVRAGVPIDQVLIPEGATARLTRRPKLGSDHMGLLARIALP